MEYLAQIAGALFSPVNCVTNLGTDVLHALGNFAGCVGGNLGQATAVVSNITHATATTVADVVPNCINC